MKTISKAALPSDALSWISVWRRNYLAWRKAAAASLLGNLADPLTNLLGLGFGLGLIVGNVDGHSYVDFLVGGMVATSAMTAASFETLYGTFARMRSQRTWDAMMCTPLTLGDILLGELVWAASKATLAGTGIALVATGLGYGTLLSTFYCFPALALTGLAFASAALVVVAIAPSYDYFVFYQTLISTPMVFLSGAVFPVAHLPPALQLAAAALPLEHSIALIRPAMLGLPLDSIGAHVGVLFAYAVLLFLLSAKLFRRRLSH
ncbi:MULTISPECIES: ABC transporter permease [Bradyrhizobium]|uniref:Nodulation protein J n=3 Tax=Bradyrhizobium TaxID=374 RepID=A0AAE5X8I6_9BRAD|nr:MULTISPECIES: ABC transporter permease [Bradyrhizobium]MCG2632934.1 ABC transporter permease [Bradyrhizobium zhengyangense]MCG2645540.1 ABC transporter permease [Bradyrhizobium zhengyangense]MCG2673137.1 ABC transporter permease [Bradyrhizobium zhengyangense]MDN4985665.1 ABC transporter permease [Bradyrhizobium sp. WYCCWR 13022]MDN5006125.1 ABC transporter permease [Bradyrhizobium sp. WYCCWR 12677]